MAVGSEVSFSLEGAGQIYLKEIRKRQLDFYETWLENKVLPEEEISISWCGLLNVASYLD